MKKLLGILMMLLIVPAALASAPDPEPLTCERLVEIDGEEWVEFFSCPQGMITRTASAIPPSMACLHAWFAADSYCHSRGCSGGFFQVMSMQFGPGPCTVYGYCVDGGGGPGGDIPEAPEVAPPDDKNERTLKLRGLKK